MSNHEITSAISRHQKVLEDIGRHVQAWSEILMDRAESDGLTGNIGAAEERLDHWAEQYDIRSKIITQLEAKSKEVQS